MVPTVRAADPLTFYQMQAAMFAAAPRMSTTQCCNSYFSTGEKKKKKKKYPHNRSVTHITDTGGGD